MSLLQPRIGEIPLVTTLRRQPATVCAHRSARRPIQNLNDSNRNLNDSNGRIIGSRSGCRRGGHSYHRLSVRVGATLSGAWSARPRMPCRAASGAEANSRALRSTAVTSACRRQTSSPLAGVLRRPAIGMLEPGLIVLDRSCAVRLGLLEYRSCCHRMAPISGTGASGYPTSLSSHSGRQTALMSGTAGNGCRPRQRRWRQRRGIGGSQVAGRVRSSSP